jgi:protein-S-isoprenylcysteine O-methyltransferase
VIALHPDVRLSYAMKILAVALSLAWGIAEQLFARRNRRHVDARERDRGSFLWITLSVALGMTLACTFGLAGPGAFQHPWPWQLSGTLVLVTGLALRFYAIRLLAHHFTSRVTVLTGHQLIRSGPYRLLRHPSYLGQLMILAGLGAMMANWISLAAAPCFTAVALVVRIRVEERAMAEHFGAEFESYRRATWRLLPLIW